MQLVIRGHDRTWHHFVQPHSKTEIEQRIKSQHDDRNDEREVSQIQRLPGEADLSDIQVNCLQEGNTEL